MAHTLPRRAYVTNEVVDPDDLNEDFQEVAGKFAGHINEHDVNGADMKAKATPGDEAYYDAQQVKWSSDPGYTRGVDKWALINGSAGDPVADIADSEGWQTIVERGGTQDMSLTVAAGDDTLFILGQVQWAAWSGTNTDVAPPVSDRLRLQFALRVDGAVMDSTITGMCIYPDPPPQQWYRATPDVLTPGVPDFDYRHIQYLQGGVGLSHGLGAARIVWSLPVTAGSRVVEMLARRLPPQGYKTDSSGGNTIQVFNRRLFVLRIKGVSPHTGDTPSVNIPAFEDGQVVNASDITTNGFAILSGAANALGNANLERGLFRNEHLPSVVYGPKAQPISPGSPTGVINGAYPGFGTNGAAWTVINDGGTNLRITGPTAGEWRLDNNPGLFVVIANVQVYDLKRNPMSANIQSIGILALRITNSAGTVTVLGETEVYVNSHNPNPEVAATMEPINIDQPLVWVVDSTQLSAPNRRITRVEVVGSVWDGDVSGAAATVEMRTQRGMIYGFVLKGVYL